MGRGSLGSVVVGTASGPGSDGAHGSVVGGSEEALFVSDAVGKVGVGVVREKGGVWEDSRKQQVLESVGTEHHRD